MLHLKLMRGMRGMRGTLLTTVVQCHVKVAPISPGFGANLNLDKEMTARASIISQNKTQDK